jgi:hypothetical protein
VNDSGSYDDASTPVSRDSSVVLPAAPENALPIMVSGCNASISPRADNCSMEEAPPPPLAESCELLGISGDGGSAS